MRALLGLEEEEKRDLIKGCKLNCIKKNYFLEKYFFVYEMLILNSF
jgi:hypothetical protein